MAVQQVSNSTEFLDLYKSQAAQEENAHDREHKRRKAIESDLTRNAERIFRPGGMTLKD